MKFDLDVDSEARLKLTKAGYDLLEEIRADGEAPGAADAGEVTGETRTYPPAPDSPVPLRFKRS